MKTVGVLAFQGGFIEHAKKIEDLGQRAVLVKKLNELKLVDALIIPGGESTTIGKFLQETDIQDEIVRMANDGMPIWGTCAGAILLAKRIVNQKTTFLSLLDITIERNAYGTQIDSFKTEIYVDRFCKNVECVFIRAPKIIEVYDDVEVLAKTDTPVAVLKKNILATTFHPELTSQNYWHSFFLDMIK